MNDTSPAALLIQVNIYRKMTGQQRLQLAMDRTSSLRWMAKQRVAEENPGASPERLHWLFAFRWLGPELALKVYGPCPAQ
jgi:hypothetical protein